mgnify:CR=1 FL=1
MPDAFAVFGDYFGKYIRHSCTRSSLTSELQDSYMKCKQTCSPSKAQYVWTIFSNQRDVLDAMEHKGCHGHYARVNVGCNFGCPYFEG